MKGDDSMPIQKSTVSPEKGYTLVQNAFLRDKTLSLKAKGLMTVLISLPPDWQITVHGLTERCAESKNTIASIINELIEHGYLRRKQGREGSGKFSASVYEIIVEEVKETNDQPETHSQDDGAYLPYEKINETDEGSVVVLRSNCACATVSQESVSQKSVSQETGAVKLGTNKYYNNKYYNNKILTNKSLSHSNVMSDGVNNLADALEELSGNISFESLSQSHELELVESVQKLLTDVMLYQQKPLMIDGMSVPANRIRDVFASLDYYMVDEVLNSIKEAAQEVSNLRAYLLTCLYRKATTGNAEASLWVNRMLG